MGPLLEGLLRSLGGSEANFLELCSGRLPYGNFHTKATSKKFRPPSGNFRPNPPELPRSPSRSGSSQEAGRKIVLESLAQSQAISAASWPFSIAKLIAAASISWGFPKGGGFVRGSNLNNWGGCARAGCNN